MPCAVFNWTVENYSTDALEVSIVFTFQNGQGEAVDRAGGVSSEAFCEPVDMGNSEIIGVMIYQQFKGMNCTYAVSARQEVK